MIKSIKMNDLINKMQKICRICLLEQPLMFSLLHKPALIDVSQMIMYCTTIKVELNDNLPQLICSSCLNRLENAYVFKQECEQNDQTLKKIILENETKLDQKNEVFISSLMESEQQDITNFDPLSFVKTEIDEIELSEKKEKKNEEMLSETSDALHFLEDEDTKLSETNNKKLKTKKEAKKSKRKDHCYECQTCKKSFNEHRHFWKHRELYHTYFSCYVCWTQFPSLETLGDHNCEEQLGKIYVCDKDQCEQEFNAFRLILLHKKNDHHYENYLQCSDCQEEFDCHKKWDQHIQKHLSNPHKCEACTESFRTENDFKTHITIHLDYFKCGECELICKDKQHLAKHKKTHERNVTCEECGKKWKRMADLKRHILSMHSDGPKPKKVYNYKPQLCTICGKTLARPYLLKLHLFQHNGEKPFACDFENCTYRTSHKQHLRIHKRAHTNERPYVCDICGKRFNTGSYLVVHKRYHKNDRPYKCSYKPCEKGFTNSRDLRTHERSHTGIKKYHCSICDSSFTTLHYFKVHSRKHENQFNQDFAPATTSDVLI